jgi:hypothetical protein
MYADGDTEKYGAAASTWQGRNGGGWKGGRGEYDAASEYGAAGAYGKTGSDWDAWGRDQDLEVDESYEQTWAKAYDAESYDEWDNKDADKWGAQAWGVDKDVHGSSSYGSASSAGDADYYGYGSGGKGGYGGWGKGNTQYGYGQAGARDYDASYGSKAAVSGYDNDQHAKQAYGSDFDSRWGKSYDFVNANEYDDEQYARKVRADDDQWAEDRDIYTQKDSYGYNKGASAEYSQPKITKTTYRPHVSYGGYGYGSDYGHGGW